MEFAFEYRFRFGKNRFYPYNENAKTLCYCFNIATMTEKQISMLLKKRWDIEIYVVMPDKKLVELDEAYMNKLRDL